MATPAFVKSVLRSDAFQKIASIPLALYFQIVTWTARIERPQPPIPGPFIMAMWHGRLIMLPMLRVAEKPLVALISGHRDGRIVSKVAAIFGIETVTGSSSRGGMRAVRELMRFASAGHCLFVTPDGPRGPRMHINDGILDLARLTGLPILPVSVSAHRAVVFNSWDRLVLPLPFSKVVIRWGEPIEIGADDDRAAASARLGAALSAVQRDTDLLTGRVPVEPV
ncbi:MAG: lysophospholipid acyltransferase family protein [Rhodopseudomonas sp.]|uniref:lysophospholipid acyltransferase family protein n=1 Tax=Rhodopseudomonas sp. TaxID=1078 RepID=UPI0017CB4149|nr:lysophospholipid acyltransferase family protein [Rhodopseudomonas sp.]NVN88421.1 lysophospholipid acyltransferase family protein [Rhodopseudomonas sp.]